MTPELAAQTPESAIDAGRRLIEGDRRARKVSPRQLARRRLAVRLAKYALPVVALTLLTSIVLWPEISRSIANSRNAWHRLTMAEAGAGHMLSPRYRGLDERGRPYMISATTAVENGPERVDMVAPRGDVTLESGAWMQVQAKQGVFMQHASQLDLSGNATLYRQDGTTMTADAASIDLKQGVATSADYTHAEGPFGTLDAQGFTLVDKGTIIQFRGPAKLVLNSTH